MNFRRTTAAAALVIGAMTVAMGTAHAEDAPQDIKYSVKLVDKTVVATLQNGTFSLVEQAGETPEAPKTKVAEVKDSRGAVVISLPIEYAIGGAEIPIKTEVDKSSSTLLLTPEKPAGVEISRDALAPAPVLRAAPIASVQENQKAINDFSSKFSIGTAIGTFVGTAIGALVGCVIGGIIIPAIGCIPGFGTGAAVGGILGMVAIGGPTMAVAGFELLNIMQAPDGTTAWAEKPVAAAAK
ncbi:hypothetical protein [Nocardia salmonicida]|uniref:hypothetical protein n=1 Tax=Nocardia salmonicida TaxID=53431 RepID=UPI0007A46235|nr:hypothetical protein [Nocardia salmonicida]